MNNRDNRSDLKLADFFFFFTSLSSGAKFRVAKLESFVLSAHFSPSYVRVA